MNYSTINLNTYLQPIGSPIDRRMSNISGYQFDSTNDREFINEVALRTDSVSTRTIQNLAVTDAKIQSLTANKITAGTINAGTVNVININANNITAGTLNASTVEVINLDANKITSGTIDADLIAANSITAGKLSVNSLASITATLGSVTAGTITSSVITSNTITGGTVRTASTGKRVMMTSSNSITFYDANGNQTGTLESPNIGQMYLTADAVADLFIVSNNDMTLTANKITVNSDFDMTNGNLDDVASIDGGGNDVVFNDSIGMNNGNINNCNAINVDYIDVNDNSQVQVNDELYVNGALSKNSGTFDIPHPDPSKKDMRLRHSFVESPTAGDLIYRYKVNVLGGVATINLPDYFKYLNTNPQVWVSPVNVLGVARAESTLEVVSIYADTDGEYNVLVIGTRNDKLGVRGWEKYGLEYKSTDKFSEKALSIIRAKEEDVSNKLKGL